MSFHNKEFTINTTIIEHRNRVNMTQKSTMRSIPLISCGEVSVRSLKTLARLSAFILTEVLSEIMLLCAFTNFCFPGMELDATLWVGSLSIEYQWLALQISRIQQATSLSISHSSATTTTSTSSHICPIKEGPSSFQPKATQQNIQLCRAKTIPASHLKVHRPSPGVASTTNIRISNVSSSSVVQQFR